MPIQRKGTPPTSVAKAQTNVLGTLSAWTDPDADDDDDAKDEREKTKKAYKVVAQDESGDSSPSRCDALRAYLDVEGDFFNMTIGVVIMLNAALIGLETEQGREKFVVFEHIFNTIFVLEMILRIHGLGFRVYFTSAWYLFDFSLVCIGTLDLWVLPFVAGPNEDASDVGYKLSVMRMGRLMRVVRLLRVLRVIRLFRMFQQLYLIMQAFNKAFQIVLLISLLALIIDYVVAIMLTQGIGHQAYRWGENKEQIELWFGTIGRSMQTLFVIMTLSNWDHIVRVLTEVLPAALVITFIVFYISVTSYTMLSLITAIITDSLVTSQQEFKRKKIRKAEENRRELNTTLGAFLKEMHEDDFDALGAVSVEDLKTAVKGDQELLNNLAAVGVATSEKGIMSLLDRMSKNGEENVNTDYFSNKLTSLYGTASGQAVVDAKYDLVKIQSQLDRFQQKLDSFANHMYPGEEILAQKPKELEPEVVVVSSTAAPAKRSSLRVAPTNVAAAPKPPGEKKKMRISIQAE